MTVDIGLDLILPAMPNYGRRYAQQSIDKMAASLSLNGQLEPIKVRRASSGVGETSVSYEIVYGYRRYYAAKKLGWKTIRADVTDAKEEEAVLLSLVENLEREDLSDYEKALTFERLNREFNETYDQIGKRVGISKQHVASYIAMLGLFRENFLLQNRQIADLLYELNEHHARILSRIEDEKLRADFALLTVREKLSVRELTKIVNRLRSWSKNDTEPNPEISASANTSDPMKRNEDDARRIRDVVMSDFKLIEDRDFESFRENHLFDDGYSTFAEFPPFDLLEGRQALQVIRNWFYNVPKHAWKIEDFRYRVLGGVSLCTLKIRSKPTVLGFKNAREERQLLRGTVVLVRKNGLWKILHEHWSPLG